MHKSIFWLLILTTAVFTVSAQRKSTSKYTTISYDQSLYEGILWRQIGPFRGGRSCTATGVKGDNNLYYMGTAGGGVWKTTDAGNTWTCISDGYFGGSIGAVAVAESDPNVVYVGEGEQTLRGDVSSGWGVWKSTDAGKTWNYIGLEGTEHISRIRIHPKNPDWVYVAAIGNLWKPNGERGVYRSKDGGSNWEKILFVSDKAGASDLIIDPNNPRIIYAATWQMKRNGYRMDSGGPDSKIFKSTDGGDTWTDLSERKGLPKGVWGIIGLAVSPVSSNRIWTIIEAEDGGVFRSDDGGNNWEKVNSDRSLRSRAWYYSRMTADTQNEDILYVMNVSYGVSKDGGMTFKLKNAPHGDHHDLWIDPDNNQRMIIADDGGAQVTNDGGENWTTYHNQPTAQFYRVTTDNSFPYRIYGAQQDNSTVRIVHRSSGNTLTERDWEPTTGGESAHLAPDPDNNNIVYGGTYKGYMMRIDHSTGQTRSVNIWPDNPAGSGVEVMKYRFNWNFPVMFSPHDTDKLYAGSNYLHVTYNEGQSWEVISPDLTRGDPMTLKSSGGPITQDNTGVEFYGTIFAMAESPQEEGVIWVGSDDGLVHITRDGGETWTDITPANSPSHNMMNCIDINPHVKGGAYLAATSYKFGDYTPYLYKTKDYGKTWTKITTGINPVHYTRTIRADPEKSGLLYSGTEWGMYVSFDDGISWQPFQLNIPVTSIRDLHVRDNDLIAATHGRSFWMIDDLTPLHQLSDAVASSEFYLYKPNKTYRIRQAGGSDKAELLHEGVNHPNGVMIHFYIKESTEEDTISIDILEKNGDLIKRYSNYSLHKNSKLNVKSGGNRMIWDMRYPGFKEFPGMVLYSSPNRGPKAVPGLYRVRLTVNGQSMEQPFEIIKDPRLPNTLADYQAQFDFLIKVRDAVSEANQAILDIRETKEDIDYLLDKSLDKKEHEEIRQVAVELKQQLEVIENNIHMTKNQAYQDPLNFGIRINNRLAFLMADQQRGDYPPTDQAEAVRIEVTAELAEELNNLDKLYQGQLQLLNNMIEDKGLKMIKSKTEQLAN
jgi:photosystem II stability/assembly factor-like uncharacterized protein/cation transport regulator ChaC